MATADERRFRTYQSRFFEIVQQLCGHIEAVEDQETNKETLTYTKNENTDILLGDLLRFLRNYDTNEKPFCRQLAEWKIVNNHLLPMLASYRSEEALVESIVKILFYVTSPPLDDVPNLLDQQRMLQSFKEAFLTKDAIGALVVVMTAPLADLSSPDNYRLVRLIISTFRNLTMIPDPGPTGSSSSDLSNMQSRLIEEFNKEYVFDTMFSLASRSGDDTHEVAIDILQTLYHLFRREKPEMLADTAATAAVASSSSRTSQTPAVAVPRTTHAGKKVNGRHPMFGGVFKVPSLTGGTEKIVSSNLKTVLHSQNDATAISIGKHTKQSSTADAATPLHVKLILFNLSKNLLNSCFDGTFSAKSLVFVAEAVVDLMSAVQLDLDPISQDYDSSYWRYYLWAVKYFVRLHHLTQKKLVDDARAVGDDSVGLDASPLSNVISLNWFKKTLERIEEYRLRKEPANLELSMGALGEMLKFLVVMERLGDDATKTLSRKLRTELMYDTTVLLEPLSLLLRVYTPTKFTLDYLASCIESIHACIALMEAEAGIIVVKKKRTGNSTMNNEDERDLDEDPELAEEAEKEQDRRETAVDENRWKSERVFKINDYLRRFSSPSIINLYLILLKNYRRNDSKVNHAIASMFKRLSKDLEFYAMFFHISVFRVFNDILSSAKIDPTLAELRDVALFITKKYLSQQSEHGVGPMVIELFFRKWSRDTVEDSTFVDSNINPENIDGEKDYQPRGDDSSSDEWLDFELDSQLLEDVRDRENAKAAPELAPSIPAVHGRGALIQARRTAIAHLQKASNKNRTANPRKKKMVKIVEKRTVKKVNAAERAWSVAEDKDLLEAYDLQMEVLNPLESPHGDDDIFVSTAALLKVFVRTEQVFVRLRELGRLTPQMLAKYESKYVVDVEEEIEKFIEVDDDEAPESQQISQKQRKSASAANEGDIEISFQESDHGAVGSPPTASVEVAKAKSHPAPTEKRKKREEKARLKTKSQAPTEDLPAVSQKQSVDAVGDGVAESPLPKAPKKRRLKKKNRDQERAYELLGELSDALEIDEPAFVENVNLEDVLNLSLDIEDDSADNDLIVEKSQVASLNSSRSLGVSFSEEFTQPTQRASSPRKASSPQKGKRPRSENDAELDEAASAPKSSQDRSPMKRQRKEVNNQKDTDLANSSIGPLSSPIKTPVKRGRTKKRRSIEDENVALENMGSPSKTLVTSPRKSPRRGSPLKSPISTISKSVRRNIEADGGEVSDLPLSPVKSAPNHSRGRSKRKREQDVDGGELNESSGQALSPSKEENKRKRQRKSLD